MDIIIRVEARSFEVQTLEYPAPLCAACSRLMFVRKRVFTHEPRTAMRLGYTCTGCSRQIALKSQLRKAVREGEIY
jgi:hypothetical protein